MSEEPVFSYTFLEYMYVLSRTPKTPQSRPEVPTTNHSGRPKNIEPLHHSGPNIEPLPSARTVLLGISASLSLFTIIPQIRQHDVGTPNNSYQHYCL